jgi:uncharacterized protein YjbI with pentapeptide repeats
LAHAPRRPTLGIPLARATAAAHNSIEFELLRGIFLAQAPKKKAPKKKAPAATSKLDAFDVSALERSLNDSATRVSTIWVSFVAFSAYLAAASANITHRQLLLDETIKLPAINIDLPLFASAFVLPTLYAIYHVYVLLQVLLLARTAAAYNAAVERADLPPEENATLRQRLANTLFAQIFAGSPREREGWLGWLLKAIAWITLAIAPILILLQFQFMFLPYHSHIATWAHRLLIAAELAAAFVLWPLVLDARQDFEWARIRAQITRAAALPLRLFGPKDKRHDEWVWIRQQALPLASCGLFVLLSLSLATFPGEPHVNLFTGQSLWSARCERLISGRFDRLDLPGVDVVDDEKLEKIENATTKSGQHPALGERTQNFSRRDLNCGNFDSADLRHVNLSEARISGARFELAKLQGASLRFAQLPGATLRFAQLQGANLDFARLQGAALGFAQLQGAELDGALLQGAALDLANLQGASLDRAQLQGASFLAADLQGASLDHAQLQGASLHHTRFQGASLVGALLQGTDFDQSTMTYARFSGVYVWRAKNANCQESRVSGHNPDASVSVLEILGGADEPVQAAPDEIAKFIERSVAGIPDASKKEEARKRMRASLVVDPAQDDTSAIEEIWSQCEKAHAKLSQKEFDQKLADFLRKLVCENTREAKAVAKGIIRNWFSNLSDRPDFKPQLASGLLGQDGKDCAGAKDLDQRDKDRLHEFALASPPTQPPAPKLP